MSDPSTEPVPARVPAPASRHRTLAVALSAAGVAVALLLGGALAAGWFDGEATPLPAAVGFTTPAADPASPADPPSESPSAEPSTAPSTAPTTAPTTSPRTAPSPTRTVKPSPRPQSSPVTSPKPPAVPSPACSPNYSVGASAPQRDWTVTFMADGNDGNPPAFCGQRRRVWWVVYVSGADPERLYLHDSGVSYLDADHLTWTTKLAVPSRCTEAWYVGRGNTSLPQTIPVSQRSSVFGMDKLAWDDDVASTCP